jgi:hypothetical protein
MAEGGYGGYEHDFVNESLDLKYHCLVCQNVLREPMLTDCCGQHYCKSCLQQCNRSHIRECPHCRKKNYHTMLDKQLKREINQLRIYCVNRSGRNCLWEDELSKLSQHLSSSCPQRESECKYCGEMYTRSKEAHLEECLERSTRCPNGCGKQIKGREMGAHRNKCPLEEVACNLQGCNDNNQVVTCGRRMLRSELTSHEKLCPFRTFECKFCQKVSTYAAITGQTQTDIKQPKKPPERGHYAECPDYPLSCKNKCRSGEIRRADMEQHLRVCPLETIQCEHWEEGCQEMVRRKDMGGHLKAFKKQHQEYVRFAYLHKKKDMKDLKAELGATKDELAATKFELNATKNDVATQRTELATKTDELNATKNTLAAKTDELNAAKSELATKEAELAAVRSALATKTRELNATRSESTPNTRGMNDTRSQEKRKASNSCRPS